MLPMTGVYVGKGVSLRKGFSYFPECKYALEHVFLQLTMDIKLRRTTF